MKIKREILGVEVEIELTDIELTDAYNAKQHEYDMTDIRSKAEEFCGDDDDNAEEIYIDGLTITAKDFRKYMEDDDVVSDMAYRLRKGLDNNDCISECLWNTAEYAIKDVIEKQRKSQEPKEVVRIQCWGDDDYDAWWRDPGDAHDPSAGCSVRGTAKQIIDELKEEI